MAPKKGNTNAKGNKGGGRKSIYNKEYANIVKGLCLLGATDEEIANAFNVSETTINNWKKKYIEFSLALKEGKQIADAKVAQSLFNRALGYEHEEDKIFNDQGVPLIVPTVKHYPPDTTAAIFWLKNRQPAKWREKQEVETTLKIEQPLFGDD